MPSIWSNYKIFTMIGHFLHNCLQIVICNNFLQCLLYFKYRMNRIYRQFNTELQSIIFFLISPLLDWNANIFGKEACIKFSYKIRILEYIDF